MTEPRLTVALTFDHDAISSEVDRGDGPVLRSRGEFGPRVGAPRVLALLEREGIPSTWFVPGHTIATFPDSVAAVVAGRPRGGLPRLGPRGPGQARPGRRARRHGAQRRGGHRDRGRGPARLPGAVLVAVRPDPGPRRGARLHLRLEPHGRRRPALPRPPRRGPRRPGRLRPRHARTARRGADQLGARRLAPLRAGSARGRPDERPVEGRGDLGRRAALGLGARAGRPAHDHDAPRGDRARPPDAHARALHRHREAARRASSSTGSTGSWSAGPPRTRWPEPGRRRSGGPAGSAVSRGSWAVSRARPGSIGLPARRTA